MSKIPQRDKWTLTPDWNMDNNLTMRPLDKTLTDVFVWNNPKGLIDTNPRLLHNWTITSLRGPLEKN